MKAPRKRKLGPGGFTLVEMLVAITIVLIFGAMAAETLKEAAGMWRTGYRRSYAYDTSTAIFQQIQDDLSAAKNQYWGGESNAYDKNVKFWADFDGYPDGNVTHGHQRLRFVRALPDSGANPLIRQAGTDPNAALDPNKGWYNLKSTDPLRPLEGMCEVAYVMGLDGTSPNPDLTTLYRAVLSPIGGDVGSPDGPGESFFHAADSSQLPTNTDTLGTSTRIAAKALPIAEGVIHFEVRLWNQYTTTWSPSVLGYNASDETTTGFNTWANSYSPQSSGSLYTWDSDRLDNSQLNPGLWGPPVSTPVFSLDWPATSAYAGNPGIACDNVFPRAVMVVVTIEPPNELSLANPLRLMTGIPVGGMTLRLIGEAPPMNEQWPFVRIDDEWIRVNPVIDQTTNTMTVVARHARGTTEAGHNPGARVLVGYTFTRVFDNPAAREYWGQ